VAEVSGYFPDETSSRLSASIPALLVASGARARRGEMARVAQPFLAIEALTVSPGGWGHSAGTPPGGTSRVWSRRAGSGAR
jgi:hypothetical protein